MNNVMIGSTKSISKSVYEKRKNALLNKFQSDTDKIFASFDKEVKSKGLTSIADTNKLWRGKYAVKLDKIEKIHQEKYRILWNSHFNK